GSQTYSLFTHAFESVGNLTNSENTPQKMLDFNIFEADGKLQLILFYHANCFRRETIEKLVNEYFLSLKTLIEHCKNPNNFGYTPSDFPLSNLSQDDLDRIVGNVPAITNIYPLSPLQKEILSRQKEKIATIDEYFNQSIFHLSGKID